MHTWYLETSAINYFADKHDIGDAIATKAFQNVKGRRWVISPVCLWEILATNDASRRESLIYMSQHLFDRELMPGPIELTIQYMFQGCPKTEKWRELRSTTELSQTWRNLVDCTDKTFIYDHRELQKAYEGLMEMNRIIHRITKDEDVGVLGESDDSRMLNLLETTLNAVSEDHDLPTGEDNRKILRIAMYYLITVVCAGAGLERVAIDSIWNKRGINDPMQRFYYAIEHHPEILYRGPLALLATMSFVQAKQSFSRGVLFDSYHAIYSVYCDLLLTKDDHFVWLRDEIIPSLPALKICHLDEIEFTYTERQNPPTGGIIVT